MANKCLLNLEGIFKNIREPVIHFFTGLQDPHAHHAVAIF